MTAPSARLGGSGADVPVRLDRMEELRRSEARYRALAEAASLDVFRTDAAGLLLTDMPGWRALSGAVHEVTGLGWLEDVHPGDRARVRACWLGGSIRTGAPYAAEFRLLPVSGPARTIAVRAIPLLDADGRVLEWVGITQDVTDARAVTERAAQLSSTTAALAVATTVAEVVAVALHTLRPQLEACDAGVFVCDASRGEPDLQLVEGTGELFDGLPRGVPLDSTVAALSLEALWNASPAFGQADAALAVLPLTVGEQFLGSVAFRWPYPPAFTADERAFLGTLASQLAQALGRAQLFEQQQSTARVLQRALLPARLPEIDGLEVAARYRSAVGSGVGGDWYDVLRLPDGRTALVLGDVMGRGVPAASTMGQVRNALRGIAGVDPTPAGMLRGLDVLFETFEPDEITTVVITVLDTTTGQLHVGNAGHLPPLLVRADGRAGQLDDGASTPLGMPTERVPCKGTVLLAGDLLVMCSDGLIERRHWSLSDGLAVLENATKRLAGQGLPLEELADALLSEVLDGSPSDDDVSLLLARIRG